MTNEMLVGKSNAVVPYTLTFPYRKHVGNSQQGIAIANLYDFEQNNNE